MTSELSVPLSRGGPVFPGEEVDVAVEMMAPAEVGRYLGYWRLTGPHMRRKFGQRVWCHIQVVDPSSEEVAIKEADLDKALAEINRKKSALVAAKKAANADEPNDDDDNDDAGPAAAAVPVELQCQLGVDFNKPVTVAPEAVPA